MDVEALVKHTVLDNAVAALRGHRAGAQTVPGTLNVALDPFLDSLDVPGAVLQLLTDLLSVAVEETDLGWRLSRAEWERPAAVANTSGQVTGQGIRLSCGQVHVPSSGGRVVVKEGVLLSPNRLAMGEKD